MNRAQRLAVLAAMMLGILALVWWAAGTDDPRATFGLIGTVLAVGTAILLVVTIVIDRRHIAQGRPHPGFFPVALIGQLVTLLSTLSNGVPSLTVAMLLAMAATIVLWARVRRIPPAEVIG